MICKVVYDIFTDGLAKCFVRFLQDVSARILQAVFNVFTRTVQGFHFSKVFHKASARLSQGVDDVCYKVFTRRLQSRLQGSYDVFHIAFTMFFTLFVQCLFARFSHFCLLLRFYKIVTMLLYGFYKALARCLQCFHNVFYNAFTRLSESVY